MDRVLIERAMESAKARIYKLSDDEKWGVGEVHQKKIDKQKEVMKVTIEALERMLPKKAEIKGGFMEGGMECPKCGHHLGLSKWRDEICYLVKHCRECGQRLDWGEEHE